jgi:hypothetical protein
METALLGRFQPQTQQNGFASRKFSLLVKEWKRKIKKELELKLAAY